MTLPSPEVMKTYASILRKPRRDKDGLAPAGEIALAAAEALEMVARGINSDNGLAARTSEALIRAGRMTSAIQAVAKVIDALRTGQMVPTEEVYGGMLVVLREAVQEPPAPKHHSFEAVGITTEKPASGGI